MINRTSVFLSQQLDNGSKELPVKAVVDEIAECSLSRVLPQYTRVPGAHSVKVNIGKLISILELLVVIMRLQLRSSTVFPDIYRCL